MMNSKGYRCFWAAAMVAVLVTLSGCDQQVDKRSGNEKEYAAAPDLKTRVTMACPKCGCPQRPYRMTEVRSFYKCSGNQPKFAYHTEHQWQHAIEQAPCKRTEF
ncbi:MAG: hypothetical protein WCT04_03600 [Planctomycetota bacterium]